MPRLSRTTGADGTSTVRKPEYLFKYLYKPFLLTRSEGTRGGLKMRGLVYSTNPGYDEIGRKHVQYISNPPLTILSAPVHLLTPLIPAHQLSSDPCRTQESEMNREVHFTTTQGAMSSTAVVPKYQVKEVRTHTVSTRFSV
jgi:hypothetical protein